MPTLKNWRIIQTQPDTYCLTGQTYNDPRTFDGDTIRTSSLKRIDFIIREAETLNTLYVLGDSAVGTTPLGSPLEATEIGEG